MTHFRKLALALLDEMKLPDFKGRHFFIARLRLIIFILCWVLYLTFYSKIFVIAPVVPLVFNLGFLITSFCYWNFLNEQHILKMATLEMLADLISQTTIIYMLGADKTVVFLFYGLYVVAAGSFFGYIASLLAATMALISYYGLLIPLQLGWIKPFEYPYSDSTYFAMKDFGYVFNLIFLPIALGIMVYGAKIAHYFSSIKEKALEMRNLQLLALNRISSTIRKVMNIQSVIDQVLKGVIQGLGFEICFLALLSKEDKKIHFYVPHGNIYIVKMEEIIGKSLSEMYLPIHGLKKNSAYESIQKNRVLIRNDMMELTRGIVPAISEQQTMAIQERCGFKKFVITPLVAERQVVGALIGASCKSYVEESVVDTLDHFANQAALAIETSQLINELQQKNIQLEEANKIKSDFLAIMSHELRTPLTAIIGFSEILLEQVLGALNKDQKESLGEVLKNAENLLQLINSILDLAKIEAGKMELTRESFSMMHLVNEVHQTLNPLLAKKNQKFTIKIAENLPQLRADRMIRQILLNLIGNAIKFTPDYGSIEVSVQYFKNPEEVVKEFHAQMDRFKEGAFRISVRDTGIGIKPEHLAQIFNIFQQVDSTFTRKYQGTGLGLAFCKQLVELHGGSIGVASQFGKGSEFKFILPDKNLEQLEIKS